MRIFTNRIFQKTFSERVMPSENSWNTIEVYSYLRRNYLDKFEDFFKSYTIPKQTQNALVIIEPREHENLNFVIKNFCYFCRNWSLYIFHSASNLEFIKRILGHNIENTNLIQLSKENLTSYDYNDLLISKDFWNKIEADKILIFQTDTFIRRFGIETFLEYDYIGAPWDIPPTYFVDSKIKINIGNGGLSLRSKKTMIDILDNIPYPPPVDMYAHNEDVYFSYGCLKRNWKIPSVETASLFSVESIPEIRSLGAHKCWFFAYKDIQNLKDFLKFQF